MIKFNHNEKDLRKAVTNSEFPYDGVDEEKIEKAKKKVIVGMVDVFNSTYKVSVAAEHIYQHIEDPIMLLIVTHAVLQAGNGDGDGDGDGNADSKAGKK